MNKNLPKPIIIGHRGACALAPENTVASFKLAVEHKADFVELDAKLSLDGVVVVIHDQTVDRTTNGTGRVNQLPYDELRKLDAGSKFDKKYAGEKIPTLDEVFKAVGKDVFVNVELTNYESTKDSLVEKVVEVVKANNMEDRVLFSSFVPGNLIKAHRGLPNTPVAMLCLEGFAGILTRSFLTMGISPEFVHPYLADVTRQTVAWEHRRGRKVNVWTVNANEDILRMLDAGVDGIFTDDPLRARQLMNDFQKKS
jgi:glycerophosphoryl diester phosphodiesterase